MQLAGVLRAPAADRSWNEECVNTLRDGDSANGWTDISLPCKKSFFVDQAVYVSPSSILSHFVEGPAVMLWNFVGFILSPARSLT